MSLVSSSILLEVDVHFSRLKANERKLVDRGGVSLKVLRATSGRSFRLVGHSKETKIVVLNAWPVPVRPKVLSGDENTLLLYLVDFSTHQNLERNFYFTFKRIQEKDSFVEVVDPLFNQIIGGGNQVDASVDNGEFDDHDGDENTDKEDAKDEDTEEDYDDANNQGTQTWPEDYVLTKWW